MKRKLKYAAVSIVILLLFTNPSLNDFKDGGCAGENGCYKKANWLIFSVFVTRTDQSMDKTYLGICKNFVLIDEESAPFEIKQWK